MKPHASPNRPAGADVQPSSFSHPLDFSASLFVYLLNDFLNARPIPKVSHFDIATLLKTTHFQSEHFQAEATRPKIKIFVKMLISLWKS